MALPDEIATIRSTFNQTLTRLRANTNLSPDGRKRVVASAYLKARAQVANLVTTEQTTTASTRTTIERRLFGIPGTTDPSAAISFRDAQDRVGRIESTSDAIVLLHRAAMSGDVVLAKAILGAAFENGWVDVVDEYAEQFPNTVSDIDRLIELNSVASRATTYGARLATSMSVSIPIPTELHAMNDTAIAALAGEAIPISEIPPPPEPELTNIGLMSQPGSGFRLVDSWGHEA